MADYDFDQVVDRRGSDSFKWDGNLRIYGQAALLPFWVADMDFATAPPILQAIQRRLQHPVLGYEERPAAYIEAVADWLRRRHGWPVPTEWLMFCPPSSILAMYGLVTQATRPGSSICVPTPTYGPLLGLVEQTGRRVIRCPLRDEGRRFALDLDGISASIEPDTGMLILCNPHNPTGRVFSEQELTGLVSIARAHDLVVVADEVHADLVRPGQRHIPLGSLGYARTATVISPNKAFNTAGLPQASIVIPDKELRAGLQSFLDTVQVNHDSSFGGVAMMAAYRDCEDWLDAVIRYIDGNHRVVETFLQAELPQLKVYPAEATYLAWLDCRGLGLSEQAVEERLVNDGGVALYRGTLFGEEGRGFLRMNIACPRETLQRGLHGIKRALG